MERETRELENGLTAEMVFEHDDSAEDPSEFECNGKISVFHSKESFWNHMEAVFGSERARQAVDDLLEGRAVMCDGKAYLGMEKYSHSGDVLAVCKTGNFPDRKWDVSPIVGLWTPSPFDPVTDSLPKSGPKSARVLSDETCGLLKASAKAELETYNAWLAGDTWGYSVTVTGSDGKTLVGEDSCWGYYGISDAKAAAAEAVSSISSPHRPPAP